MELVTKDAIRQRIWDYLEASDLAAFPRPVHHCIPNFKGAAAACDRLKSMDIFQRARTIKVNPDKPQQQARFLTLEANKMLLVPTPRLRSGLFNNIVPPLGANKNMLRTCSSSQGVRQHSSPIGLDAEIKVDLVVIGSVAVSPQGYRIGKGEGYADLEFAMMSSMGAVNDDTVVVTTVHDCQVLDDIPEDLFGEHDLGVDYILTPTRTIRCDNQRPRPTGIIWHLLTRDKFSQIPILKILRRQEAERGIDVRLKEEISLDSSPAFSRTLENRGAVTLPVTRVNRSQISARSRNLRNNGQNEGVKVRKKARNPESSREMTGKRSEKHSGAEQNHDWTMNADVTQEFTQAEVKSEKMFTGHLGKGQSASSVGASRGLRPASSRRRDLDGMFAWSAQGK